MVSEKILLGKGGNFLISTRRKGPLSPKTTYYLFTFLDGTVSLSKAQFLVSEKQELVTLSAKQQPLGWRIWAQSHQVWPTMLPGKWLLVSGSMSAFSIRGYSEVPEWLWLSLPL